MDEKQLNSLLEEASELGAIVATFHVDAYAKAGEDAKQLLVSHIAMMAKEHGIIYCKGEVENETVKDEEKGQYSAIGEVRIVAESLHAILLLSLKYAPVAIEIIKPSKIELSIEEAQNILLDVSHASQQFASYFVANNLAKQQENELKKALQHKLEQGKQLLEKTQEEK